MSYIVSVRERDATRFPVSYYFSSKRALTKFIKANKLTTARDTDGEKIKPLDLMFAVGAVNPMIFAHKRGYVFCIEEAMEDVTIDYIAFMEGRKEREEANHAALSDENI